LMKDHET